MSNNSVVKVKSNFTGGHFAFKSSKAKKAFENPMQSCKSVSLRHDDIVADIGAYVGEYSLYASRFAKHVYSYEASPNTFEVLALNKKPNMTIFNKAVVGDDRTHARLYLSKGMGASNSLVQKKARFVDIEAIRYDDCVKNATVVKIDVEGAEYLYDIIKPNLRAIILEFHPIKSGWGLAQKIMRDIQSAGFKPSYKIPGFKNGWDTNSAWVR